MRSGLAFTSIKGDKESCAGQALPAAEGEAWPLDASRRDREALLPESRALQLEGDFQGLRSSEVRECQGGTTQGRLSLPSMDDTGSHGWLPDSQSYPFLVNFSWWVQQYLFRERVHSFTNIIREVWVQRLVLHFNGGNC